MTEKQYELEKLIRGIDDMRYLETYEKSKLSEEEYLQKLEKTNEHNRQQLAAIKELIDGGVDLSFKTINNHSVMDVAVVQNNVELVMMLISYGVSIDGALSRAAYFGADRVVRYLIEEKGLSPRRKSLQEVSILASARSSRYSGPVLPYLLEIMRKTKGERLPPPKKTYELTEENMLKWLPQLSIPAHSYKKLHDIVESVFVEEYSIMLSEFYEMIEEQDPALIFACIALIRNAITSEPKDKVIKNISKQNYIHHGNLVVTGNLKIRSLMVTGNLTVKGHASNVQGCQLFVGGDFECETMYTEGPVIIGGNFKARKIETYYNDYALEVKQTLQADVLIIDHHQVRAGHFDVKERIEK
jgi:cytoskeletal protein CcmA (bactofilin family)